MTELEIKARKKVIIDHIGLILRRHPDSVARRESLDALIDRLNHLDGGLNDKATAASA